MRGFKPNPKPFRVSNEGLKPNFFRVSNGDSPLVCSSTSCHSRIEYMCRFRIQKETTCGLLKDAHTQIHIHIHNKQHVPFSYPISLTLIVLFGSRPRVFSSRCLRRFETPDSCSSKVSGFTSVITVRVEKGSGAFPCPGEFRRSEAARVELADFPNSNNDNDNNNNTNNDTNNDTDNGSR